MTLRLDWCSFDAAKFACTRWHYSRSVPSGKMSRVGVWENDRFIGALIFSRGATPRIGDPYGLTQYEVCELTRVALARHTAPVSRMLAIALRMLRKLSPSLRLIVSYADADQQHTGGIYKATNWVYVGLKNAGAKGAYIIHGKRVHPRTVGASGGIQSLEWIRQNIDSRAIELKTLGKHKYLMPLDNAMRQQVEPLRLPYPVSQRARSTDSGAPDDQLGGGGANPTRALITTQTPEV